MREAECTGGANFGKAVRPKKFELTWPRRSPNICVQYSLLRFGCMATALWMTRTYETV